MERLMISLVVVVVALIIISIPWSFIFYFDITGAVLSCLFMAVVGSLGWQTFLQWAEGQKPNGNGSTRPVTVFGIEFFLCLAAVAVLNFGIYFLVEFYKTGILNKISFFIWFTLTVVTPLSIVSLKSIKKYVSKKNRLKNYIDLHLDIYHFNEYPIYIDHLKFINSKKKTETLVRVPYESIFYNKDVLSKIEVAERVRSYDIRAFNKTVSIPVGTDFFELSYYSFVENIYYMDTFPFSFEKFSLINKYSGKKLLKNIDMIIKPEGNVDILIAPNDLLFPFFNVESKNIDEEKINKFKARFLQYNPSVSIENFPKILDEIKASGRLQKSLRIQEKAFSWSVGIEASGKIDDIRIQDFRFMWYDRKYEVLKKASKMPLPSKITIEIENSGKENFMRLYFGFDKIRLYDMVDDLTSEDEDVPVKISFLIKGSDKDKMQIFIKTDKQLLEFKEWDVNIVS